MNEEALNMSLRKFLKVVGVTSQQEIEKAVRKALADGKLKGAIAEGAALRWDDVEIDVTDEAVKVRRQMEKVFGPDTLRVSPE